MRIIHHYRFTAIIHSYMHDGIPDSFLYLSGVNNDT